MRLVLVPVLLLLGGVIGFGIATSLEEDAPIVFDDDVAARSEPVVETEPVVAEVHRGDAEGVVAAPLDLPEASSDTLHGVVVDEHGEPLAGVKVTATPQENPPNYQWLDPKEVSEQEYLDSYRTRYRWQNALSRSAQSSSDGSYEISDLHAIKYRVGAKADGYQFEMKPQVYNIEPGHEVNFTGYARGSLTIDVILPDGGKPTHAQVVLTQRTALRTTNRNHPWSPSRPEIDLRFGDYDVRVTVGQDFASEPFPISVTSEEPDHEHTVALLERTGIRGVVVYPKDEILDRNTNALVRYLRHPADRDVDPAQLKQSDQHWVNSGDPKFTLGDLTPGEYVVAAYRDWNGDPAVIERVVVRKNVMTDLRIELPAEDMSNVIIARVEDHEGNSLEQCQFSIETRTGERGSSTRGTQARRKKDGSFWLSMNEEQRAALTGEAGQSLLLHVKYGQYGTRIVELRDQEPVEVRFGPPATVAAHITNYAGHELEGQVQLSLSPEGSTSRHFSRTYFGHGPQKQIDGEGRQVLGPVEAGAYELQLLFSRGRRGGQVVATREVVLQEGDNAAALTIPPLYSFDVRVEEKVRGSASISPEKKSENDQNWRRSMHAEFSSGVARFEYVAPGDYSLRVRAGKIRGTMSIRVPGDPEILFEKDPDPVYDGLSVAINDVEGTLARAGFHAGDVIVGFADTNIENMNHISLFWALARTKEELTVTVRRETGEIEMTVPGTTFTDFAKMGGRLDNARRD